MAEATVDDLVHAALDAHRSAVVLEANGQNAMAFLMLADAVASLIVAVERLNEEQKRRRGDDGE